MKSFCCLLSLLGLILTFKGGQSDSVMDLTPLVNCNDTDSIMGLMQKCFDVYKVDIQLPDPDTMLNMSSRPADMARNIMDLQNPDLVKDLCRNTDNYVDAYECMSKIGKKCMPEDVPVMAALYPPRETVRRKQEFICANYDKYNTTCATDLLPDIIDCANVTGLVSFDPLNLNVSALLQKSYCVSFEMGMACGRRYLKQCGELTLQMFESNQVDTSSCAHSTDKPDTVKQKVVDCDDQTSVRNGYLNCLTNNKIIFLVPDQGSGDATSNFILNAMTLQQSKEMCSDLAAYKNAINCTLSLQRQCTKDILKPTVPDPASVQGGFDALCQGISYFDSACVAKNTGSACALKRRRRRRSFADQIILRHLCEDDKFSQQCLVSAISSCDSRTRSLYSTVLNSQSPAKCLPPRGGNSTPGVQLGGNHNPSFPINVVG